MTIPIKHAKICVNFASGLFWDTAACFEIQPKQACFGILQTYKLSAVLQNFPLMIKLTISKINVKILLILN